MTDTERLHSELLSAIQAISINPVRVRNVTCRICATPCAPDDICNTCYSHQARWGDQLANRAIPLTYAVRGQQSYTDARAYKDPTIPSNPSLYRMRIHAYFFNVLHAECLDRVSPQPVSRLVIVPSLSGREGAHPLERVSEFLPREWRRVHAFPGDNVPTEVNLRRAVNPSFYRIDNPQRIANRHVAIFEDTWTSGGHVQGMAVKLRSLGASQISVIVLNRDIVPGYGNNRAFLRKYASAAYNPDICPVTGGACPR